MGIPGMARLHTALFICFVNTWRRSGKTGDHVKFSVTTFADFNDVTLATEEGQRQEVTLSSV